MKNVLVTSIGSFSASCVIESLRSIKSIDKIVGCDIYPKDWHNISDEFDTVLHAPLVINTVVYRDFIIKTCKEYKINIIIPLTDIEIDFFNSNRELCQKLGVEVTIANEHFISIARDKRELHMFLKNNNLDFINTYDHNEIKESFLPLIGKPTNGRSSEGLLIINNMDDLSSSRDYSNYIFQEIVDGKICTIDYIRDNRTGENYAVSRKEHLRTKNGAGMTVEIIHIPEVIDICNKIGALLDVHGCINFEFILSENRYYLIDINPRFSAGVGFSKLAGYDFPKNLYKLYNNENLDLLKPYKNMILQKKIIEVVNTIYN